jgi:transposase-like protein
MGVLGRRPSPPPRKYPDELRECATRMAVEARRNRRPAVRAIKRIGDQLGIHPEALRTWVKQAEVDAGDALPPAEPAGASTPINFDDPANPALMR